MLKLFTISRCSLCTSVSLQTAPKVDKLHDHAAYGNIKATIKGSFRNSKNKQILVRVSQEHIKTVNALLKKHDIDTTSIQADKRIFKETEWNIEKRILLLKELGVQTVTTNQIVNFRQHMFLMVPMYKANLGLPRELNLSEKLLSIVENSKIDITALNYLNYSTMMMKSYYGEIINYYLKQELGLTLEQAKRISYKKYVPLLYNSFELLQRLLKILKEDFNFSNYLILKNYYWLFGHHPDHGLAVIKMVQDHYEDLNVYKVILRFPKLLDYDLKDLKTLLLYMKSYYITGQMIQSAPEIFHLTPSEFKGRITFLLNDPFTLVYQKHPRFLLLIRDYQVIWPRIKYLQEKNLKYATIHTLTTFHNYVKHLNSVRKLSKLNLISFLELQFDNSNKNNIDQLLERLQRHPYYSCVPLIQLNETVNYLKRLYPRNAIERHIYAVLYNVADLSAAREEILKDPEFRELKPQDMLSMCLYKVEQICHFSGSGVLTPGKYAESLKRDDIHENNEEEGKDE